MAHDLVQEIRVSGQELVERVREILYEGNVRRMIIKNSRGKTLLKVPLALGVIGVGGAFAIAPILSSVAAFSCLAKDVRLVVERHPGPNHPSLKNELDDDNHGNRRKKSGSTDDDPYEIDTDFRIIDP